MLQEVRLFKNLVHNLLGTRILHLFTVKRKTLKKNERQEDKKNIFLIVKFIIFQIKTQPQTNESSINKTFVNITIINNTVIM